ncbi:MAG: glycerol kinase GlpK, partial [Bacteroidota bacterium]
LLVDPYFSATKIKWILDNVSGVREKAIKRQILAGTVETWIIWNLTGWNIHATDVTNASRTMLFNIRKMEWDAGLAGLFDIPSGILPEVVSCSEPAGFTNAAIFGHEIPITGIAGDQQAALFGHTCFEPGDIKNTYGTGCFILMNAGYEVPVPESGMLATVGWKIRNEVVYATEGSVFIAGAAVKWLRDSLGIIETVAESEILARSIESNDGVYVVPAFSGLGAPYWNPDARGAIIGMTQGTTSAHIVRATLEAIAYQSKDVILAMQKDTGIGGGTLFADGGAAANDFLMQFQADMLSMTINRPRNIECTATGAAYLAGLTIGAWDMQRLKEIHLADRIFVPDMPPSEVEKNYAGWKNAVQSVIQSTP